MEERELVVARTRKSGAALWRIAGRGASWSDLPATVRWVLCGLEDIPLAVERFEDGRLVSKGSSRRGGRMELMLIGICVTGAVAGRGVVGAVVLGSGWWWA